MSELAKKLLFGETRIVVFGAGYIGYSTAAFYAKKGVHSLLIDIDEEKVIRSTKDSHLILSCRGGSAST